ncbi:MAG: hypothetical protein JXL97_17910 [Bacteroidales bacterium]|nr:hypothetical protein [Bacteroidales bacterium]
MKKIIFIIIVGLFVSCIQKIPPDPPILTVKPDTNVIISPIDPVTFVINGYSAEDLTRFEIETTPFFYATDSVFKSFTHEYNFEATLNFPEILPGLTEDSIVTVTFHLFDGFNSTLKTVKMRVVSGYPIIRQDTATLVFGHDTTMFYASKYGEELYYISNEDLSIDFVLVYDNTLGFVIASPDAFYVSQKMVDLSYIYTTIGKNHTKITKFSTTIGSVTPKFLYYMTVSDAYINDNAGNGVGEEDLKIGDMLAFKCGDGRKGVLQVTDVNHATKSLTFFVKVQNN